MVRKKSDSPPCAGFDRARRRQGDPVLRVGLHRQTLVNRPSGTDQRPSSDRTRLASTTDVCQAGNSTLVEAPDTVE